MEIRRYCPGDLKQIAELFRDTIKNINCKDYNDEQIRVWSGRYKSLMDNNAFFERIYTLVAEENGIITGYGNITGDGYIDHLYVHSDYQKRGIATALCDRLERIAVDKGSGQLTAYSSMTAKGFFEHRGYIALRENYADLNGIKLKNYYMKKEIKNEH